MVNLSPPGPLLPVRNHGRFQKTLKITTAPNVIRNSVTRRLLSGMVITAVRKMLNHILGRSPGNPRVWNKYATVGLNDAGDFLRAVFPKRGRITPPFFTGRVSGGRLGIL